MTPPLLLAVIVFVAAASASAEPVPRVGVVDVQAVLTKSAKGRSARQILEQEKNDYQVEMDLRRRELDILRDEIEQPELAPAVKRDKQEQLERSRREAARRAEHFQRALESHEQVLVRQLLEEMVKTIRELGLEQQYDSIVEHRTNKAIYERTGASLANATNTTDVTDDVMRRLDARQFVPQ